MSACVCVHGTDHRSGESASSVGGERVPTRILVAPEPLRRLAEEFERAAASIRTSAASAGGALTRMVWDIRENAELEEHLDQTRRRAEDALAVAMDLARSLRSAADRFEAADREGVLQLSEPMRELRRVTKGTTWGPGTASALVGTDIGAGLRLGWLLGTAKTPVDDPIPRANPALPAREDVPVVTIPVGVIRGAPSP